MATFQIANRYQVLERIGEGGMGVVYRVEDRVTQEIMALKLLKPSQAVRGNILRFKREFRAISRIAHPNCLRVYDFAIHEDTCFYTMEYVAGGSLRRFVGAPAETILPLALQLCSALDAVHGRQLVHRDVKPDNVLVHQEEGALQVKLSDFGLIRSLDLPTLTEGGKIVGTVPYMAPEQIEGQRIDARTDLYALGVVLHELLTRRLPCGIVPGDPVVTIMHKQLHADPIPSESDASRLPPSLLELLRGLLEKRPENRPAGAYEVALRIETILEELGVKGGEEGGRIEGHGYLFPPRFTGRERELSMIREAFEDLDGVQQGTARSQAHAFPRLLLFEGTRGMGKSRLLDEVNPPPGGIRIFRLRRRFRSGDEGQSLLPLLRECIREILCFDLSSTLKAPTRIDLSELPTGTLRPPETFAPSLPEEVAAHLAVYGPVLARFVPEIEEFFHVAPASPLEPEREHHRLLDVIARFFCTVARHRAIVLLVDDLHRSDKVSLEIFGNLLQPERLGIEPPVPLLLCATISSESAFPPFTRWMEQWRGEERVTEHRLPPLCSEAMGEMTASMLGVRSVEEIPPSLLAAIEERTEGVPLLIEEGLRILVEEKVLERQRGTWRFHPERIRSKREFSDLIREVVARRLRRLSSESRRALTHAAIIGRSFDLPLLQDLLGLEEPRLFDVVNMALERGILLEDPDRVDRYHFATPLFVEILTQEIDAERCRELHRRIGRWLAAKGEGRSAEEIERIGFHLTKGGEGERGVAYLLQAAEAHRKSYAHTQAIACYEAVLDIVTTSRRRHAREKGEPLSQSGGEEEGPAGGGREEGSSIEVDPLEVLRNLIDLHTLVGNYQTALDLLDTHSALDPTKTLEGRRGDLLFRIGRIPEAIAVMEGEFQRSEERLPQSRFGTLSSLLAESFRQLFHSILPPRHFLAKRDAPLPKGEGAWETLLYLMRAYWFVDLPRCLMIHLRALNQLERGGASPHLARIYAYHAAVCAAIPLFRRALAYATRSFELWEKLGDEWGKAHASLYLGICYHFTGSWEVAERFLGEAGEKLSRYGDPWEAAMAWSFRGYNARLQGKFREARSAFQHAYIAAAQVNDLRSMGQALAPLAELHYLMGEEERGKAEIIEAIAKLEATQDRMNLVVALNSAGRIARYAQGEGEDAQGGTEALRLLERGTHLVERYRLRSDHSVEIFLSLAEAALDRFGSTADSHWLRMAGKAWRKGHRLARHFRNYLPHALRVQARLEAARGNLPKAQRLWQRTINHATGAGTRYQLALACYEAGRAALTQDDRFAEALLSRSIAHFTEIEAPLDRQRAEASLRRLR